MQDRPTSTELLATLAEFMEAELMPALDGPLAYRARVAANLLHILQREDALGAGALQRECAALRELLGPEGNAPTGPLADQALELNRRLAAAIDAGADQARSRVADTDGHRTRQTRDHPARLRCMGRRGRTAMTDAVRDGLARFLSQRWQRSVTIPWLSVSSAGARRLNVLFDADDGETRHELVVTAIPNANIELTPIVLEAGTIRTAAAAGVPVAHVVEDSDDPSGSAAASSSPGASPVKPCRGECCGSLRSAATAMRSPRASGPRSPRCTQSPTSASRRISRGRRTIIRQRRR